MLNRGFAFGGVCLVVLALAGQASGQEAGGDTQTYFALSGDQVRPERVNTDGLGVCRVTILPDKPDAGQAWSPDLGMDLSCEYSLPDADGAYIRAGRTGEVGPIVLSLEASSWGECEAGPETPKTCGSFGFANIKDALAAQPNSISLEEFWSLHNLGSLYVSVTTPTNPEGEIRGQFPPPYGRVFAQFGNGGGLTSDIVMLNMDTTGDPAVASVVLLDPEGSPLDVGFDGTGGNTYVDGGLFSVEPNSAATLRTDGLGDLVQGTAAVSSGHPLEGVIRFAIPGYGVAGVPAGPPVASGTAAVRNEGAIRTALAIRNTAGFDITVDCEASIGGPTLSASFPLEFAGSRAAFVDEIFPELAGTEFSGIVTCSTDTSSPGTVNTYPQAGSFVAIVLEQGEGVFTTLPFF